MDFLVLNKQRKHRIDTWAIRRFLRQLISELGISEQPFTVVFVTDKVIQSYNADYRGFNRPTDVLSFGGDNGYLGDVLISAETAYNQARRSRTLGFETNLQRLILHGLLHLMGHDHETDHGEMRAMERRYRRRFQC